MALFLFDNVIYVFLLLWLCILIVCLTTLTEVFPCFFLSCKANARVKPRKDGARPALFLIFVLFYVFFVLFYVFLCCSLCIFRFVSFSVLFVCICILYYCHRVATQLQLNISYHIIYHIISLARLFEHPLQVNGMIHEWDTDSKDGCATKVLRAMLLLG